MHTIYHCPGIPKVGCTDNFERRKKQYPAGTVFKIIVELDGQTDKAAGDVEWFYADMLGYRRDDHYTKWTSAKAIERDAKLGYDGVLARYKKSRETMGVEGVKAAARKGAATLGEEGLKMRAQKRIATQGPDGLARAARKAIETQGPEGLKARAAKMIATKQQDPEAMSKACSVGGYASGAILRICPHCGHEGKGANIFRYHFNNCKNQ